MKKIIIAFLLLVATTAQTFAGPIVTIHLEFGKRSLGCQNFGICRGGIDVSWKYSTVQVIEETQILQINLTKEAIVGKEEYFMSNTVTFDEAFTFSPEVQKALGSKSPVTINPGKYELLRTSKGFQINIPL